MNRSVCSLFATLLLVAPFVCGAAGAVEFQDDPAQGQLHVLIQGQEAFVYCYSTNWDLPHIFPMRSPSGKSMTVQKTEPYPHHRSFWFADTVQLEGQREASIYNALYSGSGDKKNPQPPFRDRIRPVGLTTATTPDSGGRGELNLKLIWEMDHGKMPVLDDARRIRVIPLGSGEYFLDLNFTLTAAYGAVTFRSDAVHYAWPFIRLNDEFNANGGAVLVNSEGGQGQAETNLKPARWVDFSQASGGTAEGVAIFSHPANEHPHKWLTRDYGCFGPRRIDAKSGRPFTLQQGGQISTRVGVLIHRGDTLSGRVAERYQSYSKGEL